MPALDKYNNKRDFKKTSEPTGKVEKTAPKLRFVVQRHHATRLHYDLRLEMGGVLKSWAVPKGPSLYPDDKRLAMMVEDHPVSYRTFEGDIPKGNYGYGSVNIFDEGTYQPLDKNMDEKALLKSLDEGSVKVVLKGKILKGEFALVKIKNADGNAWLLIKHKDKYAVDKPFDAEDLIDEQIKNHGLSYRGNGANLKVVKKTKASTTTKGKENQEVKELDAKITSPMLATLAETLPEDGEWIFEQKLDGFRALAVINKKQISLTSRNAISFNKKFSSVLKKLKNIDREVILDGEIVAEDSKGNSSFQLLQHGEPLPAKYKLKYYVFDILALDGNDLREFAWKERHDLLKMLLEKFKFEGIELTQQLEGKLSDALEKGSKLGWEGIMAKEIDSLYLSGKRSSLWRKLKFQQSQEAVVVGYTKPEGGRAGFGALILAVLNDDDELQYVGNVGTGFNDKMLNDLLIELNKITEEKKPFDKNIEIASERKAIWVKPKIMVEVSFTEWTNDQHMRHPVFKGIRTDKKIADIRIVKPIHDVLNEREIKFGKITLKLTNQKKIYWPVDNITKGDMLEYYENIAPLMLPYLKDKPISLNRFPNGINKPSFFQKDMDTKTIPDWLKTVKLTSENTGETVNYLICNDEPTLLWIANSGSIEINPWLSPFNNKLHPDFAVLDLDPNGVPFEKVVEVALTANEIFEYAGVKTFVKTSGSTGLHIYIYLGAEYDYDIARDFIEMIAQLVNERHDDITSLERSPAKRKDKIYLDYMQNKKGATIAAPYSVRPKPGATVSTPLFWDEVNNDLKIADFDINTVLNRIQNTPNPWANIFKEKLDLKKAISKF
jgi:bifunctional non-homologous end joining protein LigD